MIKLYTAAGTEISHVDGMNIVEELVETLKQMMQNSLMIIDQRFLRTGICFGQCSQTEQIKNRRSRLLEMVRREGTSRPARPTAWAKNSSYVIIAGMRLLSERKRDTKGGILLSRFSVIKIVSR